MARCPGALTGVLLLVAVLATAGEVAAQSVGYSYMTTRSGDCYVLISRLNAGDPWSFVDGVYRFRRSEVGNDQSYYRCLLGQTDPYTGSATASMGASMAYAYGLSVDKFNQLYMLESQPYAEKQIYNNPADPSNTGVARDSIPGNPLSNNLTYTPWNEGWGEASAKTYNAANIYIVRSDGTEGWYGGAYNGTRFTPGGWSPPTPADNQVYTYVGSANASDVLLPPTVKTHCPYDILDVHDGGLFHRDIYPFPAFGNNVTIPFGYYWITDTPDPGGTGGWATRTINDFFFSKTQMFLNRYMDFPDAAQYSGTSGRTKETPSLYTSVGWRYTFWQTNSCGDTCMNLPNNGGDSSPPAKAKIVFTTYGNTINQQRTYGIKVVGNLDPAVGPITGTSTLLKFTKNAAGLWVTTPIDPDAPGSKVYRVFWDAGYASDQFRSVGISDYTSSQEFIYISTKHPDKFNVSSSFLRMGGTCWYLDSTGGTVHYQERNELSAQQVAGSVQVDDNPADSKVVTEMAADGENYVYLLKTETSPSTDVINNAGVDPFSWNANHSAQIDPALQNWNISPYFDHVTETPEYYQVYFKQEVGKQVLKGSLSGLPRQVGFAPKGGVIWQRNASKLTNTWATAYMPGASIDDTVRSEIAAINIALPPAQGSIFMDQLVFDNSGSMVTGSNANLIHVQPSGAETEDQALSTNFGNYTFGVENLPEYGALLRAPFGYMVKNFGGVNEDGDERTGSFVYGLIWPANTSSADVTSDMDGFRLRYRWFLRDTTQWDDGTAKTAGTWRDMSSLIEWADGTEPTDFQVDATDPQGAKFVGKFYRASLVGNQVAIEKIKMPKFKDPGRYEVVFQMKGGYWDISALTDFNIPPSIIATKFATEAVSVVQIDPRDPHGTNYVWDVDVITQDPAPPAVNTTTIEEDSSSQIYCTGLVQFVNGENYGAPAAAMEKSSGCGAFDYTWDYAGLATPNNYTVDPMWADNADLTIRNDGTSNAGTRAVNYGGADLLAASDNGGGYAQQYHDWFSVKYRWIMHYRDPLTGAERQFDYRWGNLGELYRMMQAADSGQLRTSLVGGRPFLEVVDAALRRYRFRIPLTNDQANRLAQAPVYGAPAAVQQNSFLVPNTAAGASFFASAGLPDFTQPVWYVPTTPSYLQFTCEVYYPKLAWTAARDPRAPSQILRPDGDPTGVLYWTLKDDPGPFSMTDSVTGKTAKLWRGAYRRSGGTAPAIASGNDPFVSGEDNDDCIEMRVIDVTRPSVYGQTIPGDPVPPVNPDLAFSVIGSAYQGELGKPIMEPQLEVNVWDNNPYLHWTDATGGRDDLLEQPRLTEFALQCGEDPRVITSQYGGIGLKADCSSWDTAPAYRFNVAANGGGDFAAVSAADYPDDLSARPVPQAASDFVLPNSAILQLQPADLPGADRTESAFTSNPGGGLSFPGHQSSSSAADPAHLPQTGNPYLWNVQANERYCYRDSAYTLPRNQLPLPIFAPGAAATGVTTFSVYARAIAEPAAGPAQTSDGDGVKGNEQCTKFALVTGTDSTPPNLQVEVRVLGEAQPLFFVAYTDHARDYATAVDPVTGLDIWDSNFVVAKKSADGREMTQQPAFATSDWSSYLLGSHRVAEGTAGTANATLDWPASAVACSSGTSPLDPSRLADAFTINIQEDAQFTITVRACDNASASDALALAVRGGQPGSTTSAPLPPCTVSNTVQFVRTLTTSHNYPKEQQVDVVRVTAADQSGNTRAMLLKFQSWPHEIDFRVISDKVRRR